MTRVILIHHHIFKNAGTSFNYALKQYFQEQFLEYDLPDSRVVTSDRLEQFILQHPQALAISGHHIAMPAPQGQEYQTLSSILLRRPLARVRSIYEFEKRQQVETEGSIKAKALHFKDYVQWRLDAFPATLSNYQTQYCSRITDLGAVYSASERDLEVAIHNLRRCAVVGTVERYDEFLRSAQQQLAQIYPGMVLEAARLNTTSQPDSDSGKADLIKDLGQDLVTFLEHSNQLDEKLYQAANEMLTFQLEQITVSDSIIRTNRKGFIKVSKKRWKVAWFREFLHSFFTS